MNMIIRMKLLHIFIFVFCIAAFPLSTVHAEELLEDAAVVEGHASDDIHEEEIADEGEANSETEAVLTEDVIKDFYAQSERVQLEGAEATLAFFKKHTHEDVENTVYLRTILPNGPPQKQTLTSNKEKFLEETKAAYEKGSVDRIETELVSIDISEDGQSALVHEKTESDYTLKLSESEQVVLNSQQSCDVDIVLNNGVPQTYKSKCDVEVRVEKNK